MSGFPRSPFDGIRDIGYRQTFVAGERRPLVANGDMGVPANPREYWSVKARIFAEFSMRCRRRWAQYAARGVFSLPAMPGQVTSPVPCMDGVPGMGAVLHTINPRPHADQVAYIADHAEDQYIFFDLTFLPLIQAVAGRCQTVKAFIAMCDRERLPQDSGIGNLLCYEELIAQSSSEYVWLNFDEEATSTLCHTSGTTGNPKGVLYSHRSSLLHTYAAALPDALNCSARDVILPVVPMFHVNAWGLPYIACMVGAKMIFPGPPWMENRCTNCLRPNRSPFPPGFQQYGKDCWVTWKSRAASSVARLALRPCCVNSRTSMA